MKKELIIIRHGMTAPNREGRAVGVRDEALTEEGQQEARTLGEFLRGSSIIPGVIFSGPQKRHTQTAGEIAGILRANIEVREALREARYGEFEGASLDVLRTIEYGYDAESMKKAGGETPGEIEERVSPVIEEVWSRIDDRPIALVTSALTACIITQVLNRENKILATAKPLKTGDFHRMELGRDEGQRVVVSFEPNVLKPPLKI